MPNQIPEETIEEVRKANDIVDVIGEYVQLKKQGKNYFGLCPFHGEKTPSFSVTQEKQIFHCFGCGKGGNVVTFIMEMEKFSFFEAMEHLASRSGITLPETVKAEGGSLSEENQSILTAYEWLTKLYHHLLRFTKDGKEGFNYFKQRGISEETIDLFQLGFAPNDTSFTAEFLKKKGFHEQVLVKAGLLSLQNDNNITDRFRGRVMFPIRNHLGKTIAFGGRIISNGEPKYLNSSESELFQKGKLLYNFDLAKKHIRNAGEAVLFEGYMDVISAFQAGVKNAIATLGTSLTLNQAKLLKRYVDTVTICYDGDNAGIEATFKASSILKETGCKVKVARLKDGMDPDDYINAYGTESFQNDVIKASETYISFYMRYIKRSYNLSLEDDRFNYIDTILKELAMIDNSIEREYYLGELSKEFDISVDSLKEEMRFYRKDKVQNKDKSEGNRYTNNTNNHYQTKKLLPAFLNAEKQLIAYMLKDRAITDKVQEEIGAAFNIDAHKIIATHLYAFYEEDHPADVSNFIEKLTDQDIKNLVIEIAMIHTDENISDKEINDYLRIIRAETNDIATIKTLKQEQKLAEQQQDSVKSLEIGMRIIAIQKQLKNSK
ncbi:DNA primase [Virgibacillus phasianinus]|uniref:DNA primase n=1 Tax=Virgibacillus phasianinus TaxID=2017483 RepID=A0A220U5H4_9BACI|nr:DNA primase [Virgibacillus phasianinus]ASK63166.1 DNA primase [Virgibacillus phasianinus]